MFPKKYKLLAGVFLMVAGCNQNRTNVETQAAKPKSDGPAADAAAKNINDPGHQTGDAAAGKTVFRLETFGNERFWTDAMRLPKGMMDKKFTPVQALKAGLQVDVEALDPATRAAIGKELATDLSPRNAPMLNDPMTTVKLINANAVIGVVAVDTNGDGKMAIEAGDKVGIACAICHTITDNSVFQSPEGGSIGRRIDGPANNRINMGALLAMAANSRAYYPNLQAEIGGKTIGRAPKGLTKDSTEAEVDAYLMNPAFYPVGTFDETSDGNGNPVANTPFFRTDLAAPWGTSAGNNKLDDIANGSYTINLDLTTLVTPEGRAMLKKNGGAGGEELANNYAAILKATGVTGYPYVKAAMTGKPGESATPAGRRVDNKKLQDMNAYTDSLAAPKGALGDPAAVARGRELFTRSCTSCHNVDQSNPVPPMLVEMKTIWPDYNPTVIEQRKAPMSPIQDAPGTFDDKMIVEDASGRGEKRGVALPLLLDLARKPYFLHDASVPNLEALLNPNRGDKSPHPFYISDRAERSDMVQFLRSLDAQPVTRARRNQYGWNYRMLASTRTE
ncbi:MAG: c-type cytochrome [Opitutaceae bacterium]|nr:c-type cytochrome [Verrucomicrobiales bacterium]